MVLAYDINTKKINLLNLDPEKLSNFFCELGEKSFRAHQIMYWIYKRYCSEFDQMQNLGKSLRFKLNQIAEVRAPIISKEQKSIDGTIKWLMKVGSKYIETVYIPERSRATLCVSSQMACALGCTFCATAQQGFNRNLKVSEIIGQVWRASKVLESDKKYVFKHNNLPITHIVFMGMGEPLLNLLNVVSAIKIILSNYGFGLSRNHVTLSTAGVVPGIDKLIDMIDVSLAISLHASNDTIRNNIMPINKKYNINCLLESVRRYANKTTVKRNRVTIEYLLLKNINDDVVHAHELASHLIKFSCKVNLIPWNFVPNTHYFSSSNIKISKFANILLNYGIITTIRKIRGLDINAACGQLTGQIINNVNNNNI